ncbi:MAG: hypothetical protein IT522_07545 [Burkholderiales bacterium]|nr:hypothetical protein [Burkholderiales bacterium]
MRCTLVVPGLAAAAPPTREWRALDRLGRNERQMLPLDRLLIAAAALPAECAIAPIAALGAGFDPAQQYVLRADPVTLIAGRDDVLLAGRVDDLDVDEAAALRASLAAHFAGDGLAFHTPRPDAWFVTATAAIPVETSPLPAITGPLHPHLPRGPHGGTWRRWLSEMQMLLHEHPVNAAREANGRRPVTGIWIAGGGVLAHPSATSTAGAHAAGTPLPSWSLYATPRAAGDLLRGLARLAALPVQPLPAGFAALAGSTVLAVLDPVGTPEAVARLAQAWLDPALAALHRGALAELVVLGDGKGEVRRWSATRPSLLTRVRARLRGAGAQ